MLPGRLGIWILAFWSLRRSILLPGIFFRFRVEGFEAGALVRTVEVAVVMSRLGYRVRNDHVVPVPVSRSRTRLRDAVIDLAVIPVAAARVWRREPRPEDSSFGRDVAGESDRLRIGGQFDRPFGDGERQAAFEQGELAVDSGKR